jgi:hypothetical protein
MPLHCTRASEPLTSRRVPRCAPLLLLLGMHTGVLVPGCMSGDRPFQTSLCDDPEHAPAATCVSLAYHLSSSVAAGAVGDFGLGPVNPKADSRMEQRTRPTRQ